MKIGDLVIWNNIIGTVVRTYESKCWRTDERGKKVNWDACAYEPFAEIWTGGRTAKVPQADLKVVNASR